jgi:signal transduction histidine kinase
MTSSILVVDDTPENLRLLTKILGEQGYHVRSAPNGERALATVQKALPDLILLDIMMPDMDGYEVCRRLKADAQLADVPIIFISALNDVFDKVTAFTAGGVDYITKPFQVEEVLARVETHLSLKGMRETLHTQNAQLQEQNRELEAFAHTVAHDLKNPLASLLGFLELIKGDMTTTGYTSMEMLDISISSGLRLNSIIDELLLLATLRKEQVVIAPVDMGIVVQRSLDRLVNLRRQYQPEIVVPDDFPVALGYAPWIEEVWVNYLSNAMKYGGQPPCIELGADVQDRSVRFWVRDNGPGIPPEQQAGLFTEFNRLERERATGHGLGLSIVRRIMGKLDGQYGVESMIGQGSAFYFTLPVEM